jgi:hypothetical protein
MAKQRRLRGFTRIDALVAGVACLVLVLFVSALHAMTQEHHFRTVCAAHLADIGKTMFLYAGDNEGALPKAGGRTTTWGPTPNWMGANPHLAFGFAADGSGGRASVNSSFYLLVKYYQAPPRLFVCPGDKGTSEFKLSDTGVAADFDLADAWDFGPASVTYKSCSFSYHHPYSVYSLTLACDPNMAVAADRNPWFASPAGDPAVWAHFRLDLPGAGGLPKQATAGNAFAHRLDGQNVLFLDGRVTFETRSYCGVDKDNIYTVSGLSTRGAPMGTQPMTATLPFSREDSFLVHDLSIFGSLAMSASK